MHWICLATTVRNTSMETCGFDRNKWILKGETHRREETALGHTHPSLVLNYTTTPPREHVLRLWKHPLCSFSICNLNSAMRDKQCCSLWNKHSKIHLSDYSRMGRNTAWTTEQRYPSHSIKFCVLLAINHRHLVRYEFYTGPNRISLRHVLLCLDCTHHCDLTQQITLSLKMLKTIFSQ